MIKREEVAAHGEDYRRLMEALRDGTLSVEVARSLPRLNADTASVIAPRRD